MHGTLTKEREALADMEMRPEGMKERDTLLVRTNCLENRLTLFLPSVALASIGRGLLSKSCICFALCEILRLDLRP